MDFLDSMTETPQDYGLPHSEWRPNQWSALQRVFEHDNEAQGPFVILELPTGSGKSGIATALGRDQNVVVYVHSLALLDQYEAKYGFTIVKGMAQYPCTNHGVVDSFLRKYKFTPSVAECPFDNHSECPVGGSCLYDVAREKALASRRMACTYPFALLSWKVQRRQGVAVWDEAHSAVEAIVQLSSIRLDHRVQRDWNLESFPMKGVKDALNHKMRGDVLDWYARAIKTIYEQKPSDIFMEDVAMWKTAIRRMAYGMDAIDTNPDWYFESDTEMREVKVSNNVTKEVSLPYMLFKPFTASTYSYKLSKGKSLNVLMSATIGDPLPITNELGIKKFMFYDYPHPVPLDKRKVFDLQYERMTWDNIQKVPLLFKFQAQRMAKWIKEYPPEWRGLILCASYEKANRTREALQPYLGDRMYIPDGKDKVGDFVYGKWSKTPGLIVCDVIQVWGQGLDLHHDLARFMIVESVPFGNLTDNYEIVRRKTYGSSYAWWQSYQSVTQACGRVTRCEQDDEGEYLENVSALADGSATSSRAISAYSKWFKDAIVRWP